jgi:alpha-L-rhamnosidase
VNTAALSLACLVTAVTALPMRADSGVLAPGSAFWPASWIGPSSGPETAYGVFHFRRVIDLPARPEHYIIRVSADNRYRLFVNGVSAAFGPQLGSPDQWRYDTVDIGPFLNPGRNVLAAQVWNFGDEKPYAVMSVKTGFLVQGEGTAEAAADTGPDWKVIRDGAFEALPPDRAALKTFIVSGPGDRIEGALYPWGWTSPTYDDSSWGHPRILGRATPSRMGTDVTWWLAPRSIPAMEEVPQRLTRVRGSDGASVPEAFLAGGAPMVIAGRTHATFLLDQGFETNAFPLLTVSGGHGAEVTLTYAEALVDAKGAKADRGDVSGKHILGLQDRFLPDGGHSRVFSTLNYRTYRYIQFDVTTGDDPLVLEDFLGMFTGYPFRLAGAFSSDEPDLGRIWEVGWRTARLCAAETYMDCPYYERLQYVGDTRIQSLISLVASGDDRLMRNAIDLIDRSRISEGLTQERYPSNSPAIISTFSLFWVDMVHDHWMYRGDEELVRARMLGIRNVLDWFTARIDPHTGMLGPLDYWTFVDSTDQWPWNDAAGIGGEPDGTRAGGSSIVTLQFAETLVSAADLCRAIGEERLADRYAERARALNEAVVRLCWDEGRGLVADTPAKRSFSQHANIMAVLSGAISGGKARALMARVARDKDITQASLYYRFYLGRAMKRVGLGDSYVSMLQPWRDALAIGLSTFPEKSDPTRSDCHAWSASPVFELLSTVCGVEPGSAGFRTVRVEPNLGPLHQLSGRVAHPLGAIDVRFDRNGDHLEGDITLPPGITGVFEWKGATVPLRGGPQHVSVVASAKEAGGGS